MIKYTLQTEIWEHGDIVTTKSETQAHSSFLKLSAASQSQHCYLNVTTPECWWFSKGDLKQGILCMVLKKTQLPRLIFAIRLNGRTSLGCFFFVSLVAQHEVAKKRARFQTPNAISSF